MDNSMEIMVTAGEVLYNGNWELFCHITGLSEYALNEGMDENEQFYLTIEQAKEIGLL